MACEPLTLQCTVDPAGGLPEFTNFADLDALLASEHVPEALAICTPPQVRYRLAHRALAHGRHVLLEKPPAASCGEVETLKSLAARTRRTLFCAWHSQFAPAVLPAAKWLRSRRIDRVRIDWREDVRVFHPGQAWIWAPGGFGCFDPGINALSVAVKILPLPIFVTDALLRYPEDCQTPIAAELRLSDEKQTEIEASFDFLQEGPPTWSITVDTDAGCMLMSDGGKRLCIDDGEIRLPDAAEYPLLYQRFAQLISNGDSEADTTPLRLVADAFMLGRRVDAPRFQDPAQE